MEHNTAKHFVLQLGSLISLYLSLIFFLVLVFGIINLIFPDEAEGYWLMESSSYNVRIGIAMMIVFLPTYFFLTRTVNRIRRKETQSSYLGLTKWLIYFSLLVSGLVLLGDLVTVILTFLEGEITTRFILKATSVILVIGFAFYYYLYDARGYWLKNEKQSIIYAFIIGLIVLSTIIYGFTVIASPSTIREIKLDEKQIQDLQSIQWQIQDFMIEHDRKIPIDLTEAYGKFPVPIAPESRPSYVYEVTETGFKLCAEFSANSVNNSNGKFLAEPEMDNLKTPIKNADNWSYLAGQYCFERIVNKN